MEKQHFTKSASSLAEQIFILKQRGLVVDDESYVKHCLQTVSFHRLSAYFGPYEENQETHRFQPNINFNHIWNLHVFDRELRLLILDALERVEIALRTSLSNSMSVKYGPWWYLNNDIFKSSWANSEQKYSPSAIFQTELR